MNTVQLTISVKVRGDLDTLRDSEKGETVTLTLPASRFTNGLADTFLDLAESAYLRFMAGRAPRKNSIVLKHVKISVGTLHSDDKRNPPGREAPIEVTVPEYMFCGEYCEQLVIMFEKLLSYVERMV